MKGNVIARVLEKVTAKDAPSFVNEVVSDKVSLLATILGVNEAIFAQGRPPERRSLPRQYVVGAVHTNTIEGFWSIFKRGVVGTFHKMQRKIYAALRCRFQFRYNNRFNPDMFDTAIAGC